MPELGSSGSVGATGEQSPVATRRLHGAGDLSLETVNLTPLTHLAITLAERSVMGLSPNALSAAYITVEGWFGLPAGALRLAPPDLTWFDDMTCVTAGAIQVAIANAAVLALVQASELQATLDTDGNRSRLSEIVYKQI